MSRTAAFLLLMISLALSACSTLEDSHRTDKTRENADRSMQQLREEEGNHK